MDERTKEEVRRRLDETGAGGEYHVSISHITVDENGTPKEISRRLAGNVMDGGLDEQPLEDVEPEEWVTVIDRRDDPDEPDRYNAPLTHAVDFLDMDGVELADECVDENGDPDPHIVGPGEPIDPEAIAAEAEAEQRERGRHLGDRADPVVEADDDAQDDDDENSDAIQKCNPAIDSDSDGAAEPDPDPEPEPDDADPDPDRGPPRGWDPADVDRDEPLSANRQYIVGVYERLVNQGFDDAADEIRFADPVDRRSVARKHESKLE